MVETVGIPSFDISLNIINWYAACLSIFWKSFEVQKIKL